MEPDSSLSPQYTVTGPLSCHFLY